MKKRLIVFLLYLLIISSSRPLVTIAENEDFIDKTGRYYAAIPRDGQLWIGKNEIRVGIYHKISDVAPFIVNKGNTVVPLKTISDIADIEPEWNPIKQEIAFNIDENEVLVKIGKREAFVNGIMVQMPIAPFIKDDRAMITLRFVSENLGGNINYQSTDQSITIEFPPRNIIDLDWGNLSDLKPIIVDGEGMYPTFGADDRALYDKEYYKHNKPNRGDIILFEAYPGTDYLKRVIGIEGDTIEIKSDILFVNGKPVNEPYLDELKKNKEGENPLTYDFGPVTVPPSEIFVLGDNRRFSKDSRMIGNINEDKLVGKVICKYYIALVR